MMPDEITATAKGAQKTKINWIDLLFATGPRRNPEGIIGRLIPPYAFAIACSGALRHGDRLRRSAVPDHHLPGR